MNPVSAGARAILKRAIRRSGCDKDLTYKSLEELGMLAADKIADVRAITREWTEQKIGRIPQEIIEWQVRMALTAVRSYSDSEGMGHNPR